MNRGKMHDSSELNALKNDFSDFDKVIHISKKSPEDNLKNQLVQAKTLGFEMNYGPKTMWSDVRGEITHQYLKFVNAHLVDRLKQIEKLKKIKTEFENEIDLLQTNDVTNLIWLPETPIEEMSPNEINEMELHVKLQKDIIKSKIEYFKNKIERAEEEIQEKEWQLNEIDKRYREKLSQQNTEKNESEEIVKEELEFMIKKYGIKELTYAVDVITSSRNLLNNFKNEK